MSTQTMEWDLDLALGRTEEDADETRAPRVGSDLAVDVQTSRGPMRCPATNLSLTGIFLAGVRAPPGREVSLSITFPEEGPRRVVGRVVRYDPGVPGVALTFSRIGWDDLLCVARYLAPRL